MRAVECSECGRTPFLVEASGDLILRCECDVGLAVDSVEYHHYTPENWEPCRD